MSPLLRYNLAQIPDIVTVEPGKYIARLKSVTQGASKSSGQPMLTWKWTLLNGPNKGQVVTSWTSLQEQALSGLKQHLLAFGMKGKVNASTDVLIGKTVILVMGIRKGENAAGQATDFSSVIALLPRNAANAADEDGDTETEAADETTEDAGDETEETPPAETKAERLRRELAEAEAEEKPKPKPKPETKAERLRRELAEAEAEEGTGEAEAVDDEEEKIVQKPKAAGKPKLKRVQDLKTTSVDSDEEEPF
jgi:hypothetical protein